MRLDKFLQVARLVKKRESAKELCLLGRAFVNGRKAKPSAEIKIGDEIRLVFGNRVVVLRVLDLKKQVSKKEAALLFEILETRFESHLEDDF